MLNPRIDRVNKSISHAPRKVGTAPQENAGVAWHRAADEIATAKRESVFDKNVGQAIDFEMWVIRENGMPRFGARTADDPIIRCHHARRANAPKRYGVDNTLAKLHFFDKVEICPTKIAREKCFEFLTRDARLHHLDKKPLHLCLRLGEGEIANHARNHNRVVRMPCFGFIAEQFKFPWGFFTEGGICAIGIGLDETLVFL